jgi:carboxymethylenebutenolidase
LNDLQEYFIHEFVEDYKDGLMSRRDMIRRVLYITGGVASTATILSALGCGTGGPGPTPAPATKAAEKVVATAAPPARRRHPRHLLLHHPPPLRQERPFHLPPRPQ